MPDRMQEACQPDLWGPFYDVAGGPLRPDATRCPPVPAADRGIDSLGAIPGHDWPLSGAIPTGVALQLKRRAVSFQDIPAENQDNLEGWDGGPVVV